MSFEQTVLRMWPAWVIGLSILLLTFKSKYRPLLAVKLKPIKFFLCFIAVLVVTRLVCWKLFQQMTLIPVDIKALQSIPWQASLFVFWEDATYVLPFMIFKRIVHGKKYMRLFYYATMFLMCLDFGAGHIYQSIYVGLLMTIYIPMVMDLAEQYGVGTVMICHTIFDLSMIGTAILATKGT